MVMLKYKGSSPIIMGKYRIKFGMNDIKDEDFWEMMKSKSFAYRVTQKIFEIPESFPKEKPADMKPVDVKPIEKEDKALTKHVKKEVKEEEPEMYCQSSVKGILILIEETCDHDYLNHLLESDQRVKVKEAVEKRLKHLKSNK